MCSGGSVVADYVAMLIRCVLVLPWICVLSCVRC